MAVILDKGSMVALGAAHADEYAAAEPFPHIVIDNFLPDAVIKELQEAFPRPEDPAWGQHDNMREVKLVLRDEALMPDPQLQVIRELNGQAFMAFLNALTGIQGLMPDPALYGGGLHQIRPGGMLKVHADFNLHPVTKTQRRLNAILYLNDDWDESYGGILELWDKKMTEVVKRVVPIANRLLVFSTKSDSFHGHPDPLSCPPDRTRRSMAWYYYTIPEGNIVRHSTLFQPRPGESLYTNEELRQAKGQQLATKVRAMTPDVVATAVRSVRKKIGGTKEG